MPEEAVEPKDLEGLEEDPTRFGSNAAPPEAPKSPSSPKARFLSRAKNPPKCKDGSTPGMNVQPGSTRSKRKERALKRQQEVAAEAKLQAAQELKKLDADGDGNLSKEEWVAGGGDPADFDECDKDGNGTVDKDELEAFILAKKNQQAAAEAEDQAAAIMDELDADGDGMLSKDEWLAGGGDPADFDEFDKDGGGQVDKDELVAFLAERAAAQKQFEVEEAARKKKEEAEQKRKREEQAKEGKNKDSGGCCIIS